MLTSKVEFRKHKEDDVILITCINVPMRKIIYEYLRYIITGKQKRGKNGT